MKRIQELMTRDGNVIMVGDGVNDAPALMQATVGVAMGSGTDVARETASVVLLGNNLMDFVAALKIARRVHRTILVNFVGTLAVDGHGASCWPHSDFSTRCSQRLSTFRPSWCSF
jgi:P-type E1-E2 ATPase